MIKFIKKFILFFSILFFLLLLLTLLFTQFERNNYFVNKLLIKNDQINLLDFSLKNKSEIFYFCDSTNFYFNKYDFDKSPISYFLSKELKTNIVDISHAAYNLDIYYLYCKYIINHKNKPKVVIIPINLRSFSVAWYKNPNWQFEEEKLIFNELILNGGIFLVFHKFFYKFNNNFKLISNNDFFNTDVIYNKKNFGKIKDFENLVLNDESLKKKIILYYMYDLDINHPYLISLKETAKLLQENHIEPIFYLTPIDNQICERYLPGIFEKKVNENKDLIENILKKENFIAYDFSFNLSSDNFTWKEMYYPNEHLNEKGRKWLAKKLGEIIKDLKYKQKITEKK